MEFDVNFALIIVLASEYILGMQETRTITMSTEYKGTHPKYTGLEYRRPKSFD